MYSFDDFKAIVKLGFSEDIECQILARSLMKIDDYIHRQRFGDSLVLVLGSNEIGYDGDKFELLSHFKPFVFTSRNIEKVYLRLTGK